MHHGLAENCVSEKNNKTATIKTIPIEKRTTMYNRNETNGKYCLWGHDVADLVLAEISFYMRSNGELIGILTLNHRKITAPNTRLCPLAS